MVLPFLALGAALTAYELWALLHFHTSIYVKGHSVVYHNAGTSSGVLAVLYVIATCGSLFFSGYRYIIALDQYPNALASHTFCIYTLMMEFTWSERKRSLNLKQHGLDFLDAVSVFEGPAFTYEDDRFSYREQRFVSLGLLAGIPVSTPYGDRI